MAAREWPAPLADTLLAVVSCPGGGKKKLHRPVWFGLSGMIDMTFFFLNCFYCVCPGSRSWSQERRSLSARASRAQEPPLCRLALPATHCAAYFCIRASSNRPDDGTLRRVFLRKGVQVSSCRRGVAPRVGNVRDV